MEVIRSWKAIAEDGNGKIHIFMRSINESDPNSLSRFERDIESRSGLTILAMYREADIAEYKEV